jgi:TM2 domain-containing membrane protein YozV
MEDLRRSELRELARLTAQLNAAQQTFFQAEYGRHRRDSTTSLLLCLLLGAFGAHYFYFGRLRAGMLRLLFCWTLVPLVTSLVEARTITSRAFRYNASLANELLLALENTVDEQSEPGLALAAAVQRATVMPTAVRAAIAAPAAASTPESELAPAAWAGRESAASDPADLPHVLEGAAHVATGDTIEYFAWTDADAMPADPAAIETFVWPTDSLDAPEQVWHPGAEADPSWAREPIASQWGAERPQWTRGDEQDDEPEPLPWYLGDGHPAIAGAAAGADADFTAEDTEVTEEQGERTQHPCASAVVNPRSLPDAETPATASEREPVFLYEAAPATRRDAVRLGPPSGQPGDTLDSADTLLVSGSDTELDNHPIHRTSRADGLEPGLQEDFELAALGSALASGLADLLRDRPARPRSVPLSRPLPGSLPPAHLGAAAIDFNSPAAASPIPHQRDEITGDLLWASATLPPPQFTPAPRRDDIWMPIASAPADTDTDFIAEDTKGDGAVLSSSAPFAASPDSLHVPLPTVDEVQTSLTTTPAAAYVSTPSQNLRRRVVQRVIVRKMAVVEGHVVAESTVERQVPVVADDDEMAERVLVATDDAARAALTNLMRQAPAEALPAIRLQIYALDSAAAVQHLHAVRG